MKCLVDNIHKTLIMLLNVIITFLFYMSNAIFSVFSCFTIKSFLGYVNFYCYLISLSSILCHSKGGLDLIPNQLGNLIRLSTTLLHKRDVIGKFNVHIRTTGHTFDKNRWMRQKIYWDYIYSSPGLAQGRPQRKTSNLPF